MPVYPAPKTLRNLTIDNILRNIEFWCKNYVRDFGDKFVRFVEGPFDCVTPKDCYLILNELATRKVLKRHHIYLLVNPYLDCINLNAVKDICKSKLILELAIIRCQRLNKVILKRSNDFTNIFLQNVDIFNNLKELELPETRLSNDDVGMIGLHAVNLQYLNLMDTRCGNNGLRTLFLPVNPDGQPDEGYGKCAKLCRLDVRGTEISPECAAEIYNLRESHWKLFRVDRTFDVLMSCLNDHDIMNFKTDYLSYLPDVPSEKSLETYVQAALCLASQSATDINLWDLNGNDAEAISQLQHFAKITSLTVDIRQQFDMLPATEDFVFDKGLSPIFWNHGRSLTFVMLTFVRNLDLGLLVSQCCVLESLKLQYNVYSNATTNFQVEENWPLKTLVLLCCTHPGVGPVFNSPEHDVLRRILAHAHNMEKMVISQCSSFVDEVLLDAAVSNSFQKLNDLMITNCRFISMQALEESILLKDDVPVENVLFFGCDEISRSDYDRYKRYIEKHKYKVQVDWQ